MPPRLPVYLSACRPSACLRACRPAGLPACLPASLSNDTQRARCAAKTTRRQYLCLLWKERSASSSCVRVSGACACVIVVLFGRLAGTPAGPAAELEACKGGGARHGAPRPRSNRAEGGERSLCSHAGWQTRAPLNESEEGKLSAWGRLDVGLGREWWRQQEALVCKSSKWGHACAPRAVWRLVRG